MATPGRRLKITHHTGYRYADVVDASFNEVRMTPLSADGQVLLSHHLQVSPSAVLQTYVDYWGAHVEAFDVHVSHRVLEITATSLVDTPPMRELTAGVTWEVVRSAQIQDDFAEYLATSEYVDDASSDDARVAVVARLRDSRDPQTAALAAVAAVRERITYTPGATSVYTTAAQAWAAGHGVCQDFSHVTLSLLRSVSIPARYVSGYLHSEEPALGVSVVGESHAWVEYWDGEWIAIDPTNNRGVGAAHVVVARGRDYSDVPPLKGIYAGGASEGIGVKVEITQIA